MTGLETFLFALILLFVVSVLVGYGADMFFDWAWGNNNKKTSRMTYTFLGIALVFCVLLIKILTDKRD